MTPFQISAPATEEFTEIGALRTGRFPHRRLRVSKFAYMVAYRVREHDIYVVAIVHTSRRPDYWKDRG